MSGFFRLLLLAVLAANVTACGVKGKLKSPSQIESDDKKKAAKEAKDKADKLKAQESAQPQAVPVPAPASGTPPAVETK